MTRRRRSHALRRRYGHAKTRWPDWMVLESVDKAHLMTPQAMARAYELVDQGYIDARGTWILTAKGREKMRRERTP